MTRFSYVAKDTVGSTVTGIESASNREALADRLAERGLYLMSLRNEFVSNLSGLHIERVTKKDLVMFTSQLIPVVASGVPLLAALTDLEENVVKQTLKNVVRNLRVGLESGQSLSATISRYPNVFSDVYINTVRAGEESGRLEESLVELRDFLEWQLDLTQRIRNIFAYPMIVVVALLALNYVIVTVAVPRFRQVYRQLQANSEFGLPWPTRFVVGYSDLFANYGSLVALVAVGSAIAFVLWIGTDRGRLAWDRFKLRIPVFDQLLRKVSFSRFAHHFGTMYSSGVGITRSLDVVKGAMGNAYLAQVVDYVSKRVGGGQTLAVAMRETKEFPNVVVQMVGTAERTGRMEQALANVIRFFDREVDASVRRTTTYLGPVLLAMLAAVLLLMGTAFYLPLFRLLTAINAT